MKQLPPGWEIDTLQRLCLPITKSDPVDVGRKSVRYIDIGTVDGARHSLTDVPEIPAAGAPSRCRQLVQSGDTVFSTVRPYLEKIAYVDESLDGEFASTGFCVLRPGPRLDPKFLYYFSISRQMLDQVLPFQKGVSYPAVLDKEVRSTAIPVPPPHEQRRLVELLEYHLSRLDVAESLVATSLRRLMSLRRSVLRELHNGDLTPLSELAHESGYGTSEKCVPNGPGPAVVRIPNLIEGQIDLTDEKRIASTTSDVERYRLTPGDLLIVRTNGSVDLIGRSAVVQEGVDAAFASYLIRYRLRPDRVMPEWVHAMLSAPQVRARIETLAASSAGQHNLSLGKLDPLELPIPRLDVQAASLSSLTDLDDHLRRLRNELSTAQSRAVHLRHAVLTAAFSGRLTGAASDLSEAEEMIGA